MFLRNQITQGQLFSYYRVIDNVLQGVENYVRSKEIELGRHTSIQHYITKLQKKVRRIEKGIKKLCQEPVYGQKRAGTATKGGCCHNGVPSDQVNVPAQDKVHVPGVDTTSKTLEFAAIPLAQVEEMRLFILAHPHITKRKEIRNLILLAYWDTFIHRGLAQQGLSHIRHAIVLVHASFAKSDEELKHRLVDIGTVGSRWKAEFDADVLSKCVHLRRAAGAAVTLQKDEEKTAQRRLAHPMDILQATSIEWKRERLRGFQAILFSLDTYEPLDDNSHAGEGPS